MIEEKNDEGLVDYAITFLRSWLAGFRAKKNIPAFESAGDGSSVSV